MTVTGLGSRLAAVRSMANLSQEAMAQRLDISRSAYQYYERGERDITGTLLLRVPSGVSTSIRYGFWGVDTEHGKSRRHDGDHPSLPQDRTGG